MNGVAEVETFGERLKRLRLDRGLKPGELAWQAGVTEGAIRQMESGQTKVASFPVGVKLAEALGVSARYLAIGADVRPQAESAEGQRLIAAIEKLEQRMNRLEARLPQPVPDAEITD